MAGGQSPREWAVVGSYFEACNCEAICPCRRVGARAGGRSTYGICQFVLSWLFGSCLRMLARGEKGLRAGELFLELDRRRKVKASAAGKQSGAQRRLKARIPSAPTLKAEKERLMASGMEERNTAAKLAQKYGVTPAAIRAALKRT